MFGVGLGIQITLKLVFNLRKVVSSPKAIRNILLRKDVLNLGLFLGLYSGLFRVSDFKSKSENGRNRLCV